ncbi:MAG: O-antigen ligase family protein [Janthinobacterium lividum]
MTISKKKIIKLYVAFCICMDADVFLRIFGGLTPSANGRSGVVNNPVMFSFTALLILGTLALLLPIIKRCGTVLLNNPWLTGLYAWSIITIFWSPTPAMIVRGGLSIWAFLLCGVIASRYLEVSEVAELICTVVFFLALLSILFQLFFPVHETMAPGWTGVYGEKNHLGIGMGVGCIAQMASTRRWSWFRVLQTMTFLVLLGLSQSTTSMVFVFATVALYLLLRLPNRVRPLAMATLTGTVVLAFALVPNLTGTLFSVTGKNTNFTGRDVIWAFTVQQWKTKPIQGYGLYSFWEAEDTLIQQQLGWNPRQAHNGILEVGVTTGIVGVTFLLGCIVSGVLLIVRAYRRGHRTAAMWLLLSWVAIMIDNVTEADYMIPGPLWFTYCLVYFLTYAELRRAGKQSRQELPEAAESGRILTAHAFARGGMNIMALARHAGRLERCVLPQSAG